MGIPAIPVFFPVNGAEYFLISLIIQYLGLISLNMDANAVDKALQVLVKKRNELAALDYSNPKYDDLEEQLHDLEDDFQDKYGADLENVLQTVHDQHCPDNDVLLPIAYMGDGVPVELDNHPGKEAWIILEADPLRILLRTGKDKKEVVWSAKGQ